MSLSEPSPDPGSGDAEFVRAFAAQDWPVRRRPRGLVIGLMVPVAVLTCTAPVVGRLGGQAPAGATRPAAATAASVGSVGSVGLVGETDLARTGLTAGPVRIRAVGSGQYLRPQLDDLDKSDYAMVRAAPAPDASWAQLVLLWQRDGTWAIRSTANALYFCVETTYQDAGYAVIRARSSGVAGNERFMLYRLPDGAYLIRSASNGKYLTVEYHNGGKWQAMVHATADAPDADRFTIS